MRITNLKEGMELFYINNENKVKQCTYIYSNNSGKKYVSFISKKGAIEHTFLPKGTLYFDNKEEAITKNIENIIMKEAQEERKKAIEMELFRQQSEGENEELRNLIFDRMENSENINQLPLYNDLLEMLNSYTNEDLADTLDEIISDIDSKKI